MNNIASIKKLIKIICISFVLLTCMQLFNSVAYAEMYKLDFKLSDNQVYIILAEVNDNVVTVKEKFSNMSFHHNSEQISESSFYNVIRERYEEHIRYYLVTNKTFVNDAYADKNADYLLWLLETFVENETHLVAGNGSCKITYILESESNNSIIYASGVGGEASYNKSSNGKNYYDIIKNALTKDNLKDAYKASSKERRVNPFFREEYMKYSNYIYYNDEKLDEVYTDEKLVSMILDLKNDNQTGEYDEYVTVSETTEERITIDGIYAELNESGSGDNINVKLEVKDSTSGTVATFNIVESGTEVCYANVTTGNKVIGYDNGNLKIINKTDKFADIYLMYYESNKNTIDNAPSYVALNNIKGKSIDVYKVNGGILKKVASVVNPQNYVQIKVNITGNVRIIYNKTYFTIRKGDSLSDDINVGIKSMKPLYNDSTSHFDINFPVYQEISGKLETKELQLADGNQVVFLYTDGKIDKTYKTGNEDYAAINNFLSILNDTTSNIYLEVRSFSGSSINLGKNSKDKLAMSNYTQLYKDGNVEVKIPVKPLLLLDEYILNSLEDYKDLQAIMIYGDYKDTLLFDTDAAYDKMSINMLNVINQLKPIFMLIILIFLLFTGVTGIIESKNPDARAQMMEKYKNIFFGIIFFACAAILVTIISSYVKKSFETYEMPDTVSALMLQIKEIDSYEESNIFIALIDLCLDISTVIMDIVNSLYAKILSGTGESIDIMKLIYNVYDEQGYLSGDIPFDTNGVEWTRYMTGYKALLGVGLLIMLIAIMKMAIEYMVFAGDEKKITEIKKTFGRIVIASLIMVLTPYCVKLLIYVFNLLTSLLPVNYGSSEFKLTFSYTGITRTLLNFLYVSMKCKIFYVFLIRKIMISILLIVTPIVAATWAVSEKFQSIQIWLGEMITNIALQFAYACGFMLLMIMSYEGQSNEVGLILMMVSLQLSKFIKDSMQGFFNEWGGIDEEALAGEVMEKVTEVKNKVKGAVSFVGGVLVKTSEIANKDQTTTSARVTSNIGNIMQGNFGAIQSQSTSLQNLYNDSDEKLNSIRRKKEDAEGIYKADKDMVKDPDKRAELEKYEQNWDSLDNDAKLECRDKGGAFKSLYNYKDEDKLYKKKLHERAAIFSKLQEKKNSGVLNRLRSIGERESDAELDASSASNRTFRPVDSDNITKPQEAYDHLALYGGDESGSTKGVIQDMQDGYTYTQDKSGLLVRDKKLSEVYSDIDNQHPVTGNNTPEDRKNKQIRDLKKQQVTEQHFKKQNELIMGYIKDSQDLFKEDAFKEKIKGLIENYEKEKMNYADILGPTTKATVAAEVKQFKNQMKNGKNGNGRFSILDVTKK